MISIDNEIVMANALGYDYAYRILYEHMFGSSILPGSTGLLVAPTAVCCAFACELFLKTMLPENTKGHRLYSELFISIDKISSDAIIEGTIKQMQLSFPDYSECDFYTDLKKNEKAFEDWRYFHESKGGKGVSFDISFMKCFEETLKSLVYFYYEKSDKDTEL